MPALSQCQGELSGGVSRGDVDWSGLKLLVLICLFCRFCQWLPYVKDEMQNKMMTMKLLKVLPFLLIWGVWNRTRVFEVALSHCWSYLRCLEAQKTRSHLVVWADNKPQAHIAGSWQLLLAEWAQAVQAVPYFVPHSGKQPWCLVAPWSCNYLKQFESQEDNPIEAFSQKVCYIWSSPKYFI